MNTQNTNLTQQDIDALVTQLSNKFDVTKIQKLPFSEIQKIADKYIASDDPEFKGLGEELKNLDPKIFDLTPAESSLSQLHDIFIKLGKSKYEADRFGLSVLRVAIEATMQEIISQMNEETLNQWENLQSFNPNVMQQTYLLDETSKVLSGKSFDEIYESNLDKAVKLAAQVLTSKRDKAEDVKSLTEEQANSVLAAFNSNQYEVAIQLIYNFAQENGTISER